MRLTELNVYRGSAPRHDTERIIAELEHDGSEQVPAIAPLGKDPDHCPQCRSVAATRERQAACTHPEESVGRVEITGFGDAYSRHVTHCEDCGTDLGEVVYPKTTWRAVWDSLEEGS